ncbi:MAG: hypothetical protein JXB07_10500, partial [Anaerolineae bacterium]|nr:hypothetical protein [Anaerolineae bacterium]
RLPPIHNPGTEFHMDTLTKFTLPGIALLLTLVFGIWLSSSGKPYNGILFNIHKLIALGAVIAAVIQLSKVLKGADSLTLIIALLVVAGLCAIALFASGALMSMEKMDYRLTLTIHQIAPVVMVIALALVAYLLMRKP